MTIQKFEIKRPADFHDQRRRIITQEHPRIKDLPGYELAALFQLIIFFMIHIFCLALSAHLAWYWIVLLSYTVGAFIRMRFFSLSHEFCHNLVHPKIKNWQRSLAQLLTEHPGMVSYFPYYKWFHLSHHSQFGTQSPIESFNLAREFGKSDGDNLPLMSNFTIKKNAQDNIIKVPFYRKTPIRRFLYYGFCTPLINSLAFPLIYGFALPFELIYFAWQWRSLSNERRRNTLIIVMDRCIFISGLYLVAILLGWQGLLYLGLSQAFSLGLGFHPCLAFWITAHKSHEYQPGVFQPTTSVYGPMMNFLCDGLNCHVEHHDFPNIPSTRLKHLSQMAEKYYLEIPHYKGVLHVFGALLGSQGNDWIYANQDRGLKKII